MLQRDIFLQGEGKAWLERNRDKLGEHDPVSELIEAQGIKPTSVLEIGCADGWRLKKLKERYGCYAAGVDPGLADDYFFPDGLTLLRGGAHVLPSSDGYFDLVIFGFCLYLCDPCDYFKIVAESDRVLKDGGYLIIHDFAAPSKPFRRPYAHKESVWSHHFNWEQLWTRHPGYQLVAWNWKYAEDSVALIRKNLKGAFRDG